MVEAAPFVLTLIAATGGAEAIRAAAEAWRPGVALDWLSDGEACDIAFESPEPMAELRRRAGEAMAGLPVDAIIQPAEGRRKRLLVADMDSTIIEQECIDEMAALAGVGPQVAAITERAMRGELDFEAALIERMNLIRGLPVASLQDILDRRITLTPGARELTATMRANGARCILVSGGFTFFTDAIAKRAGFDASHGNTLLFENEAIHSVKTPLLGREAKRDILRREAKAMDIPLHDTIAVGDGANDLAMLREAGLGVAFRAKPVVAREAGARIAFGDLTALLYMQGYRKSEFVTHSQP